MPELTQVPNPEATRPTGMCWMKAKAELEMIQAREAVEESTGAE